MDIRTKLALALVTTSLLAMGVLGTFAYQTSAALLREVSERQLDALAESKQRDLEKVVEAWRDRVALIRSRTRLRTLLARSEATRGRPVDEIGRILDDALRSVANVDRIAIYDVLGEQVAAAGASPLAGRFSPLALENPDAVLFDASYVLEDERVVVRLDTALRMGGRTIGVAEIIVNAQDLLDVTGDYTGLGKSGESLVIMRGAPGEAVALSPLRHDRKRRRLSLADSPYLEAALAGDESLHREGVSDYRGASVWAATRSLPGIGWGLVVKMDTAEELQRPEWLREQMMDLGLAIGAVAILGGTLLGLRLGRPLRELRDVVERIRGGETELRADDSASDEVGFLARALNDLLDAQKDR